MIALTTYATGSFVPVQAELVRQALNHGARRVTMWRREDITRTKFYKHNREILDRPRGAGYWLWKPYIILTELKRLNPGDFLIYYDCGKPDKPNKIKRPLSVLTDWCHEQLGGMLPGLYTPRYGRNSKWIKGECFSVMGCDAPVYKEHPQVQGGLSVWEKHDASIEFVSEWLHWCSNPVALLDQQYNRDIPNAPDFVEHRHDQAILTLLTIKRGLRCVGSPLESHPAERRINNLIDRIRGDLPAESFADLFPDFAENFPDLVAV